MVQNGTLSRQSIFIPGVALEIVNDSCETCTKTVRWSLPLQVRGRLSSRRAGAAKAWLGAANPTGRTAKGVHPCKKTNRLGGTNEAAKTSLRKKGSQPSLRPNTVMLISVPCFHGSIPVFPTFSVSRLPVPHGSVSLARPVPQVYPLDKIVADSKAFHKFCFRCTGELPPVAVLMGFFRLQSSSHSS
jgi:hypothetical protein